MMKLLVWPVVFIAVGTVAGGVVPAAAPAGLQAEYTFAEGAATTAGDSSGNGNTATLQNGVAWTSAGRVGSAIQLDGVNDYVALPANSNLVRNAPGATLATWINISSYPASGAFKEVISIAVNSPSGPTNTSRAALAIKGDGTRADLFAGARSTDSEAQQTFTADVNLLSQTWVHCTAVADFAADSLKIYVNGTLAGSATVAFSANSTPDTASTNGALGAQDKGDSNFLNAKLDQVRIYNRALSAAEVQALASGDTLQAHWKLDETSGLTASDASGNAHPGTLKNGLETGWVGGGQVGGALQFDGVDDHVQVDAPGILRNVNAATVAAWIKPSSIIPAGSFRELVSVSIGGVPSDVSRFALALRGDGTSAGDVFLGGRGSDSETQKSTTFDASLQAGEWAHVCGVVNYSQGTLEIYINGLLAASAPAAFTQPSTANSGSPSIAIGAQDSGGSNRYAGAMDEVRVYGRALTACEVQELAGRDGLQAYWKFDETGGTTAADASATGLTATLKNGATFVPGKLGNALNLDGVDDHADLGLNLPILKGANAATVAAWINLTSAPPSGAFREIVSVAVGGSPSNTSRLALAIKGTGAGTADLFVGGRSTDSEAQQTLTAVAGIQPGSWRHVAATLDYSHNQIRLYLDGSQIASVNAAFSQPVTPTTAPANGALGAQDLGTSNFNHAKLDEVRIYCRVLSAAEIASLAASVAPAAPVLSLVEEGNQQVKLSWTSVPGADFYNLKRSTTMGTGHVVIASPGNTTFTDVGLTNEVTYFYVVTAQNAAGPSPDSNEVDAKPTAGVPSAPVISSPASGAILNTASPTVSGSSSSSGLTITLLVDGSPNGTTVSGVAGNWTMTPAGPLAEGIHNLTARATNAAGTSPVSSGVAITVDTIAPVISSPFPPEGSTAFSSSLTISASWSDGGTGLVLPTSAITLDGSPVSNPTLTAVDFSFGALLSAGTHTVSAQIRDAAGNLGSLTWSFTVLLPPPAPTIASPANGSFVTSALPTVTGTSSTNGLTITLLVDGVAQGTTTSGAGGAWSLTPSAAIADGSHILTAIATNAAGTSPASTGVSITVDTQPPSIFNPNPPNGATITVAAPLISGSWTDATSGINTTSSLITLDGAAISGASLSPTGFSFGAPTLSNGIHSVAVQVADQVGNSASFAWSFTVSLPVEDLSPPVITGLTPADASFARSKRPVLSASVSDQGGSGLASVVMKLDGAPVAASVSFSDSDHATITFVPTSDLAESSHTLVVEARDGLSNFTSATSTFTVDATPPTILAAVSPSDPLQGAKTITASFSDTYLVSSSRRILVDLTDRTAEGTFSGNTWTLAVTLGVGAHSVVAQAEDLAVNLGQGTVNFSVTTPPAADTKPPTVALSYPASTVTRPAGSVLQVVVMANDQDPGDTGISTVEVLLDGVVQATKTGADAQSSSYYTFSIALPATAGTSVQLSTRAVDQSGNEASTASQTVFLSSTPSGTLQSIRVEAPAVVTAGESFNVLVTFLDGSGNPSPTSTGLRVTSSLSSTPVLVFTSNQSQVTVPFTIQGAGVGVVEAQDFLGSGVTGTTLIQVNSGPPSQVQVEFFRKERLSPGKTLSEVRATVTDAAGNAVRNATVTWTIEFFQNGTSLGQQTLTATTDSNGVAQIPSVVVPQNSTRVSAGASVPTGGGSTVSGSAESPVVPDVIFNIAFQHQAVEAGVPVSFTITAIDPETGSVKTDFTGTVHVYRYSKRVHGAVTVNGQSVTDGEKIAITFTEADQGVKFVEDGIILTERGETVLVASTEAPVWTLIFTNMPTGWGSLDPFATIEIQELTNAQSLIGGYSNEIVVLPSRPSHFVGLSLEVLPITSVAILVDKFDNPVFLEPVGFSFKINDGAPSGYADDTDVAGTARGFGPTSLDSSINNRIEVTAKSLRHPAKNLDQTPNPDGVPEVTTSRTLQSQDAVNGAEFLTASSPTEIELGQGDQSTADVMIQDLGQSCDAFVSIPFTLRLQGEEDPGISFTSAFFESDDADLEGNLDIQPLTISGTFRNKVALQPGTDSNGNCIPAPFNLHVTLRGILVLVPEDGHIPARHPDGRLNTGTVRSPDIRTIALFGKTLNFIGSVVLAGNPHLPSTFGQSPAGVYVIDAEEVRRTMVINPGLIPQNPSTHMAGTFRVQVMDKDITFSNDLQVRLESFDTNGQAILDPLTQQRLTGTDIFVPLLVQSARDSSDPNSTSNSSFVTVPIVAVDRTFQADEAIGAKPSQVRMTSQSSVPSDGQTMARIDIQVTFDDGTPAPGANVELLEADPKLRSAPVIIPAPPTDISGRTQAFVKSSTPGTLHLKANVNVPGLDPQHPAFSVSNAASLRVLFFDDVRPIIVIPGGKVRATLCRTGNIAEGWENRTKEAIALGIQISVRPEGENASRSAAYSIWKGLTPLIDITFLPNMDVFFVPDATTATTSDPNLYNPQHRIAILVDGGSDGVSSDLPQNPALRIVTPDLNPWKSGFTRQGNTLTWRTSVGTSPFMPASNRLRIVTLQTEAANGIPTGQVSGPSITTARVLIYLPFDPESELLDDLAVSDRPFEIAADSDGTQFAKDEFLIMFNEAASDSEISSSLRARHLAPVEIFRRYGLVVAKSDIDLSGSEVQSLEESVRSDPIVSSAVVNLIVNFAAANGTAEDLPELLRTSYTAGTGAFGTTAISGLRNNVQHFFMETFAAHRLLQRLGTGPAKSVICIGDSGFGDGTNGKFGNNLSVDFDGAGAPKIRLGINFVPTAGTDNPAKDQPLTGKPGIDLRDEASLFDGAGHGTEVLHFAGGKGIRFLGTGKDAEFLPFKLTKTEAGQARMSNAIESLQATLNIRDVDIINSSWSTGIKDPNDDKKVILLAQARQDAIDKQVAKLRDDLAVHGKIWVKAAGNDGSRTDGTTGAATTTDQRIGNSAASAIPLGTPRQVGGRASTIVVGASKINNPTTLGAQEQKSAFSNPGTNVWVVAPGDGVQGYALNSIETGKTESTGGTSVAAPQVAGLLGELFIAARRLKSAGGAVNFDPSFQVHQKFAIQLCEILALTAEPVGGKPNAPGVHDDDFGFGRINAWKAMLVLANDGPPNLSNAQATSFPNLGPAKLDKDTQWYGFRIRTNVIGCQVFLDTDPVKDLDAATPPNPSIFPAVNIFQFPPPVAAGANRIQAYRRVSPGGVIPAPGPVTNPDYIMAFSIRRRDGPDVSVTLAGHTKMRFFDPKTNSFFAEVLLATLFDRRDKLAAGASILPGDATDVSIPELKFSNYLFDVKATK